MRFWQFLYNFLEKFIRPNHIAQNVDQCSIQISKTPSTIYKNSLLLQEQCIEAIQTYQEILRLKSTAMKKYFQVNLR